MPFLTSTEYGGLKGPEHLLIRDFQERVTPNETQRTTLIVAGVYILVIAVLWRVFYSFGAREDIDWTML